MGERGYSLATWKSHKLNPKDMTESTLEWIFVVDLLNFSFWSSTEQVYSVEGYTGYWALCAAINRGLREGIPITTAAWYACATDAQLEHVFRPDSTQSSWMPMLSDRIRLLREAGDILVKKFEGKFANVLLQAQNDAFKLIDLVCCNFHSFLDVSTFKGRPVWMLKRAQILVADIWACFEGKSFGHFHNIDHITMFADYRIPQQLESLGLLCLSEEFKEQLSDGHLFSVHEEKVIELRGCSIWVVELLRRRLAATLSHDSYTNAILIDFYLWDTVKDNREALSRIPIHRTRSYFY